MELRYKMHEKYMTSKGRLIRMDIIVKGVRRMDGENHEIVQQNNSAKVKPIMNQSEKRGGEILRQK